jgi:hypothetical protein
VEDNSVPDLIAGKVAAAACQDVDLDAGDHQVL